MLQRFDFVPADHVLPVCQATSIQTAQHTTLLKAPVTNVTNAGATLTLLVCKA